jgi:hypothetical protein
MSSGDGGGSQVIDPTMFEFQGQDQQPQGQSGQQNVHPDSPDWEQKPYNNEQGAYNPHYQVLEYHSDGSCHTYDPTLNVRSEEHTGGHHKIWAPNFYGKFMTGEYGKVIGSHQRPLYGGHCDANYVCHQRINYGGGYSMTSKGDSAVFHGGNHSSHTSGSHSHEIAGSSRTRVNGPASSHSTHDPDGNLMAIVSHTNENSHMANINGNSNMTAGQNPRQVSGKGNIVTTAKMNTDQQTGQDWKHQVQGQAMHQSQQQYQIKAGGPGVVLQGTGGMKIPAIMPPSVQVKS